MQVRKPTVRNLQINPSNVYAQSPFRPTAILDGQNKGYLNQLNQAILRATNPFQVSDKSTLEYIRKHHGVDSGSTFDTVGILGGAAGAAITAAIVASSAVAAAETISAGAEITAGAAASATGYGAVAGIPMIMVGVLKLIAAAGTVAAGYTIGKAASQMLLTPEGRIFSKQYFRNLGNSFSARPISTVLTTASSIAYPIFRNKLPLKSLPAVQTFIYMQFNTLMNKFGNFVDEKLFGEITYQQQISYTTLSASVGDVFDMTDGNPFIRGGIMAVTGKPDKAVEKIGAAYGLTEEYDPFRFADLRTEWGIDLGNFANGIVDTIGEIVIDGNFITRNIENSVSEDISKALLAKAYDKATKNPNSVLSKILMKRSERFERTKVQHEDSNSKIKSFKEKIKEAKTDAKKLEVKKEFLNSLKRTELYELYKLLEDKPGHANSKTRKSDLVDLLSQLEDSKIETTSQSFFQTKFDTEIQNLKNEGVSEWTDSRDGKKFAETKVLEKLFSAYINKFTPETRARNKEQLNQIRESNKALAIQTTYPLFIELLKSGRYTLDEAAGFQSALVDLLLEETGTYNSDMTKVRNQKDAIANDLNNVMEDIHKKGKGSYFENSGFSFDSMIAKEAIEKGYKAGKRVNLKLINKLPQWRFQNEVTDKITTAMTFIVDPVTRISRYGASKAIEKIKATNTNTASKETEISIEALEEAKITVKQYKEILKIESEIYNQLMDEIQIDLDKILNNDKLIDGTNSLEELNNKITQLELDTQRGFIQDAQEEIKSLIEQRDTLIEEIKETKNKLLNDLYTKDSSFKNFYDALNKFSTEIKAIEEQIKEAKKINTAQKITYKKGTSELNSDGEKLFKQVNSSNISKVKKRIKLLEERENTIGLTGQETEELENLKINSGIYHKVEENKQDMMIALEFQRNILMSTSSKDLTFTTALFHINTMTNKILKYGVSQGLEGLTISDYDKLVEVLNLIKGKTDEEAKIISAEKGFDFEKVKKFKETKDDIKELLDQISGNTKELSQEEIIKGNKEQARLLYNREILKVAMENQIGDSLIKYLGEEIGLQAINTIKNNDEIELKLDYSTELLTFLNPTLDKGTHNEYFRFLLNDQVLADYFSKEMSGENIQKLLDVLSMSMIYENKSRRFSKKNIKETTKNYNNFLNLYLIPIIEKARDTARETNEAAGNILTEDEANRLLQSPQLLDYLATALIATHKRIKSGEGKYKVKFNNASQAQIGAWLYSLLSDSNEFKHLKSYLDVQFYELNKQLNIIEDKFNDRKEGQYYIPAEHIRSFIKKQTAPLFNSPLLRAMSYDYTKIGALKDYYDSGVRPFDTSAIALSKEQTEYMNEQNKKYETHSIRTDVSEALTDVLYQNLKKMQNDDALKKAGLSVDFIDDMFEFQEDKAINLKRRTFGIDATSLEEYKEQRAIENIDQYNRSLVDKIMEEFRRQHPNKSLDELNEIETEFLKKATRLAKQELLEREKEKENDYRQRLQKTKDEQSKLIQEKGHASYLVKKLIESGLGEIMDVSNLDLVIRGATNKSNGRIVFNKNDKIQTPIEKVLEITGKDQNGNYIMPTQENINKLMELSKDGVFKNFDGAFVNLSSLRQLEFSGVLNKYWLDALYEYEYNISKDETTNLSKVERETLAFLRGYNTNDLKTNDKFYQETLENAMRLPSEIRLIRKEENSKDYKGEKPIFKKVYNGDPNKEIELENQIKITDNDFIVKGTIIHDLLLATKNSQKYNALSSFSIEVSNIRSIENNRGTTTYRILKLVGLENQTFEVFVPESYAIDEDPSNLSEKRNNKVERKTYFINGNKYIRQGVAGEKDTSLAVQYIFDQMQQELVYQYDYHKETSPELDFDLRASQKSLFNIFFDQRFTTVGLSESEISEFIWVNPNNTNYEDLLLYNEDRLEKSIIDLAVTKNQLFVDIINSFETEYSLNSVSSNPNSIYKKIELKNEDGEKELHHLNDLFLPYNRNTKEVHRAAIVLNAIKNQKHIDGAEAPLVQTKLNKYNPEYDIYNQGGTNLRIYMYDISFEGDANFEDAAIMGRTAAKKRFGTDIQDGFKLINRHSGKQSVIIISDEEMAEITNTDITKDDWLESMPEVALSRSSMVRRGLYGMMQEVYDTNDIDIAEFQDKKTGKVNRAAKHADHESKLTINKENASKVTTGYMYFYLTDFVDYGETNEDGTGVGHKTARENFDILDSKGESIVHRGLPKIDPKETLSSTYNNIVKLKYDLKDLQNGIHPDKEIIRYLPYQDKTQKEEAEETRERLVFSKKGKDLIAVTEVYDFKKQKWMLIKNSEEIVNIKQKEVDGMVVGIEELDTFESLKYITDSEGKAIDPYGVLVEYFYENSFVDLQSPENILAIQNDTIDVDGKGGVIKSQFLRRKLGHSGYNVILPDTLTGIRSKVDSGELQIDDTLKDNIIVMPIEQALKAGIAYRKEDGSYGFIDVRNANEGMVVRYPSTGRRSFIHFQIVLETHPDKQKAIRLSTSMHILLNADHDGDRVAWHSYIGASKDVIDMSRKAFGHNYFDDELDWSDNAPFPGFQNKSKVNRDQEQVVNEEAGKTFNNETGKWEYSKESNDAYLEFLDDASKSYQEDSQFTTSFEKQKTLKEYSGYLTGLFDQQLQRFFESKDSQEWFSELYSKAEERNNEIKKLESIKERTQEEEAILDNLKDDREAFEKLMKLNIRDFPTLINFLKQVYSQKTFDFSKHGKKQHKIAFELLYDTARISYNENFANSIRKLIDIVSIDKELTDKLEKDIDNIYKNKNKTNKQKDDEDKSLVEKYAKDLKDASNTIKSKYEEREKEFEQRAKEDEMFKFLESESINRANQVTEETNETKAKEEFDQAAKDVNSDITSDEYLEEAFKSEKEVKIRNIVEALRIGYNMKWNLEHEDVNNIFTRVIDIIKSNLGTEGIRRTKSDDLFGFSNAIKYPIFDMLDKLKIYDPSMLHSLSYVVLDKNGNKTEIPLMDLFYVYTEDSRGGRVTHKVTANNAHQFLSEAHRHKYKININMEKLGLFGEDLATFYIDAPNKTVLEESLFEFNQDLFNSIDNFIVKFLENAGINRPMGLTPILYGKIAYEVELYKDVFLDLSNYLSGDKDRLAKSQLGKALISLTNDPENNLDAQEVFESLKGFMIFNKFIEQVDDGKITNVLRLLFEGGIVKKETPIHMIESIDDFSKLISQYDLIRDSKHTTEEILEMFQEQTKEHYLKYNNKTEDDRDIKDLMTTMWWLINDINGILEQDQFNALSNFWNMSFENKIKYIINIQNIRNGSMLGEEGGLNLTEDDINSLEYRSELTEKDERVISSAYQRMIKTYRNPNLSNGNQIADSIDSERINVFTIGKNIKESNRYLRRFITTDEALANAGAELGNDQSLETIIFFRRSREEKQLKKFLNDMSKLFYSKFEMESSQSEIAKEIFNINKNHKIAQNLLSLFLFDSKDTDAQKYADRLRKIISEGSLTLEHFSLSNRIIEYMIALNEMQYALDPTLPPILPSTLQNTRNAIYSNLSLEHQRIVEGSLEVTLEGMTMNNIYSVFFNEYRIITSQEGGLQPNNIHIFDKYDQLMDFYTRNNNVQSFGLEAQTLISVMFGKILYDNYMMEFENNNKTKDMGYDEIAELRKEETFRIGQLIQDKKDIARERLFSGSTDITNQIIEDEILEIDDLKNFFNNKHRVDIATNKESIQNIHKAITAYHEGQERKLNKSNKVDTLFATIVSHIPEVGEKEKDLEFSTKSLYNVFHQLNKALGGKWKYKDSDDLAKVIAREYHQYIIDNNIQLGNNRLAIRNEKVHTAMIDILINHEVMMMFSEYAEQNKGFFDMFANMSDDTKEMFINYKDKDKRKNYIVFDNETLVSSNQASNKIYELSYIVFDDNGNPIPRQQYIFQEFDRATIAFLRSKGFDDTEIENIKKDMLEQTYFDQERDAIERFLKDSEGKKLVGHNVEGDIDQVNNQYERILKKYLTKEISKSYIEEDSLIKEIESVDVKNLEEVVSKFTNHEWKYSGQFQGRFFNAMVNHLRNRIKEEFMTGTEQVYSKQESEQYATQMKEIAKLFITANSVEEMKSSIISILETANPGSKITISDDSIKLILDAYILEYERLKQKGTFLYKIPSGTIGDFNQFIPDEDSNIVQIGEIKDDRTHFSESMFKLQAFYSILNELKTMIDYNGISYKQKENLDFMRKEIQQDTKVKNLVINSKDEKINHYYNLYLEAKKEGDIVQEYLNLKKAISKASENEAHKMLDGLTNIDGDAPKDFIELLERIDPTSKTVIQTKTAHIESYLNKKIQNASRKIFGLDPREEGRLTKFSMISHSFYTKGKDMLVEDTFYKEIGINPTINPDLAMELYNRFIENYNKIVSDKEIMFYTHDKSVIGNIEYASEIDNLAIQMAFTALADEANPFNKYLFKIIDEDFELEDNFYSDYEEQSELRRKVQEKVDLEYQPIKDLLKVNRKENFYNKAYFSRTRHEFKNKILRGLFEGNWNEVAEYINSGPSETDANLFIKDLIERFSRFKEEGINMYTNKFSVDNEGNLNYTIDYKDEQGKERKLYYDETNKSIQLEFAKQFINTIYKEINNELYVNEIRKTDNNQIDVAEQVLYSEYLYRIQDYDGYSHKASYIKEKEYEQNIDKVSKFTRSTSTKIDHLTKHQYNFLDFIEPFKKEDGTYYEEALLEALQNGFLGKNYKITLVSDIHDPGARSRMSEEEFGLIKDDLEELKSRIGHEEFIDKLKNTNSPIMKVVNVKSIEDLRYLLEMSEDVIGLGFSSYYQLHQANQISYAKYESPKHIKRIENTIVKMQKFAMTTSPGFFSKMIYNNLFKNAIAILGTDNPLVQGMNFFRQAAKVSDLDSQHNSTTTQHIKVYAEINEWSKIINDSGETLTADQIVQVTTQMETFLKEKVAALEHFLEHYIGTEKASYRRKSSEEYKKAAKLNHLYKSLIQRVDEFRNGTNFKLAQTELNEIMVSILNSYDYADYETRLVMLAGSEGSTFDFYTTDLSKIDSHLETFDILKLIDMTERVGMMYTPFDLSGRMKSKEIRDKINNKAKEELGNGMVATGVDWIVNHSLTGKMRKTLLNKITRHGRIHGLLLDTYVNGQGHDEAMMSSLHRFFNFGNKSQLERDMAIFYPFAGYFVRDLEYHLNLMTDPRYMRLMTNIHQGIQSWYKRDEDDEETLSPFYAMMVENQGWVPMGKNWGMKIGNPMHSAIHAVKNPYEALERRKNPLLRGIESVIGGKGFDPSYHASLSPILNAKNAIENVVTGNVRNPADILPSLFYQDKNGYRKYTPRNYRINYDWRNLNRQLFFEDGSRRTPSRNPYTTAKNIRYQALVNASINRRRGR